MTGGVPAIVADTRCRTGRGPLYHPDRGVVYWVDTSRGDLLRYDLVADDHGRVLDYDGTIGGFTIQEDGDFLLFCDCGRVRPWRPRDGFDEAVGWLDDGGEIRCTGAVADPRGRVFAGTASGDFGTLSRLDTDGSVTTVETGVAAPRGFGFAPDRRWLYVTGADAVYRYGYDEATGEVTGRRVFADASDVEGTPDGVAVDDEGGVWTAFRGGGRVARYDPRGTETGRVEFPTAWVTGVAFGGPGHDTAYVTAALDPGKTGGSAGTTAGSEGGDGEREGDGADAVVRTRTRVGTRGAREVGAGALFAADPDVSGVPGFRSRVETRESSS